jgi:mono/diheme cytochrome c family protein
MSIAALLLPAVLIAGAPTGGPIQRAPAGLADRKNPFEGDARARRAGEKLFASECAGCHGAKGVGSRRAPALNGGEVRDAQPGALFWVLRNGSLWRGMPSFAHLPEARRWQIVVYLKSLDVHGQKVP